jgi:glycosyltransferase involved in cell wall biosynthesis
MTAAPAPPIAAHPRFQGVTVAVVIPALDEERALPSVLAAVPPWVATVIVADNGSRDGTARVARDNGATVVSEPRRGYGQACLTGIAAVTDDVDVVVFLDGDASDEPAEMDRLVRPIAAGEADMVLGSRTRGVRQRGALTVPQMFGNWLACTLIRLVWGARFTDLGPFRAIRRDALADLAMADTTYGWTVEMQVKAARAGLRCREVPVSYRRRIGRSKISGTVRGVIGAGSKILYVIGREAVFGPRQPRSKSVRRGETIHPDAT